MITLHRLLATTMACCAWGAHAQEYLPNAHSHNDYEQAAPFHAAFDNGFHSIEADVWLVDGRLLVAHDLKDADPRRTLSKLYLEPLAEKLDSKGGWKQGPAGRRVQLLIDIKSDATATLAALEALLNGYPSLVSSRRITFAISGNRPPVAQYGSHPEHIRFDGRPDTDYDSTARTRIALISNSYASYLSKGSFLFDTAKARRAIDAAHALGKPFRFWGTPDDEKTWEAMIRLGVDFVNTDKVEALTRFLVQRRVRSLDDSLGSLTLHGQPSLMPYNRIVSSAGRVVRFGDPSLENHALDVTPLAGTLHVAVQDRYGILVLDTAGTILDRLSHADLKEYKGLLSTYSGIKSFTDSGRTWIVWSAAAGNRAAVMTAEWNGRISGVSAIPLASGITGRNAIPAELYVETTDQPYLYLALNGVDSLAKIRWRDRRILWKAPTGVAPYGVTVANGKAYVSNWAGPQALDSSRERAGVPWGKAYTDPRTGATAMGSVSVIDKLTGRNLMEVPAGLHPNVAVASPDARHVFVCNGNSDDVTVLDTRSDEVAETIHVGLFRPSLALVGSTPNGLSVSPDGSRLYVSNGLDNAVAVVELGRKASRLGRSAHSTVVGHMPTEAYPAGSTTAGDRLFVANLEGEGVDMIHPARKARGAHYQSASVSIIPLPDRGSLEAMTEASRKNALQHRLAAAMAPPRPGRQPLPVPERIGEPSLFKHIVYIIKENKTYDQVFGDLKTGRGDSSLCIFGESITPNMHALARTYGWMDNFHASGKSSAEGHQWSNAAIVSDYVEKNVRAWFRSYPHRQTDAMVYNSTGYIWNHALDHGRSVRIYGEACLTEYDKRLKWADLYRHRQAGLPPVWRNSTTIERIRPVISPDFPDNDNMVFSDQLRADIFLRDWERFEKEGNLPNLVILSLPNDHSAGTSPGFPTPRAMVADNDLALGRIVERISKSRYFDSTVIFVTQDDSQSGWDHISGYRTVGLVISNHSTGGLVTTNYNQTSMVRTMEQILGLPPMNVIDATATPMSDCFSATAVKRSYTSLAANVSLDEMNKPLSALRGTERRMALKSMDTGFEEVDNGRDDDMNRILWHYAMGRKPYPKPPRRP